MGSFENYSKNSQQDGVKAQITLKSIRKLEDEDRNGRANIPLFISRISAGKPYLSADDIDLNMAFPEDFFPDLSQAYLIQVEGDSMQQAGIEDGDVLLVDASATAENNNIVIVSVNGEKTVKRLIMKGDVILLSPENNHYEPIVVTSKDELDVFGVVIRIIKKAV
ncbi:MAG: S24 family peptidase [Pseudomonadota bacterium]